MMNFKNTKMAKVISGFVGISTAVMMMGPALASAATVEELTAQINALLAQVTALQASTSSSSSSSSTMTAGHMFSADLTIGSKGADVVALQQILVSKGFLVMPSGVAMGYFGGLTKAAVSAWQASAGISPTAGYVGPKSRAALNSMSSSSSSSTTTTTTTTTTGGFPVGCTSAVGFSPINGASCATGSVAVVGGGVTAALDASSPSGTTIIAGATAKVASFKISNGTSAAAKVTMVKMKRTGVSSDSTLRNVYLYVGAKRMTDSASVATGNVNFSDSNGIIVVPAGGSVVLDAQVDIEALNTTGQTVGMMLTEVTSDAGVVGGLPVSGAQHTIATAPAGMSVVDFNFTTTPTGGSVDPQVDYTMWQNVVNVGSRDALLSSIRFRQTGSVNSTDLKNFRLHVDGVQVGSAVEMIDGQNFVTFDFTASPLVLKAGGRTVKLVGDIIGGSGRSFSFSLQQSVDAAVWDSQLMVRVTPLANATTFSSRNTGTTNVNAGILTITKKTDSPSGNVVLQGSGVTLAKFDLKAQGEKLKVENLTVTHSSSTVTMRNVALFADGVQVGSTQNVIGAGVLFNLGSSLQVETGKTVVLEIRGDVFNSVGNQLVAGNTLTFNVTSGAGSNVYRTVSFGYQSYPAAPVAGNQLTVAAGSVILSKFTAYANQVVTVPQTAYKIGEFRLTGGSTEGVNLDTITLAINGPMTVTNLQNLYVVYGSKTSQIKSTGAASQTWSINEALAANASMDIKVYATLSANATLSASTSLTMSGTSQSSGNAVTSGVVVGQDIVVGLGSITSALDASTPVAAQVVSNSMPKVASFKFTGSNDNFTITELWFTATSGSAAIAEIVVKDGAIEVKRQALNGTVVQMTGLSVPVAYNSNKVLDVYVSVGGVGTGFATSSLNVGVALDAFKSRNSNGVEAIENTDRQGNAFYAFKTKPTITANVLGVNTLPTTVLNAGTMTVAKFTITADAGSTVSWKKLILNVSSSTPSGFLVTTGWNIYDVANESTPLANVTNVAGASTVTFTASADQEISGSKTYVVKVTFSGTGIVVGASHSANIGSGVTGFSAPAVNGVVAGASSFDWSDQGVVGHTLTTNDWYDNFLVKNLPTDSQTLTK